jgi:hypothetical protein
MIARKIIALAISPIEQAKGVYCEGFGSITTMKRSVNFLEPTIYRTGDEHANCYTIDAI